VSKIVSALVIFKAADGTDPDPAVPITSENIDRYKPDPRAVAEVRGLFTRLGFESGPAVGIGFSITAPMDKFTQVFEVPLRERVPGEVGRLDDEGDFTLELPITPLPKGVRSFISAVTFTPLDELNI